MLGKLVKNKPKQLFISRMGSLKVHPAGIEPTSSEPESGILSIELRVHGYVLI